LSLESLIYLKKGLLSRRVEILHSENRNKSDILTSLQCYCLDINQEGIQAVYTTLPSGLGHSSYKNADFFQYTFLMEEMSLLFF